MVFNNQRRVIKNNNCQTLDINILTEIAIHSSVNRYKVEVDALFKPFCSLPVPGVPVKFLSQI